MPSAALDAFRPGLAVWCTCDMHSAARPRGNRSGDVLCSSAGGRAGYAVTIAGYPPTIAGYAVTIAG
jgi:hypothetical protein